jgi:hypothetical protein
MSHYQNTGQSTAAAAKGNDDDDDRNNYNKFLVKGLSQQPSTGKRKHSNTQKQKNKQQ